MIKHIKCDIFESGADIICHQVNCQGVMGSGIAKQVRQRYPWVYGEYREFCSRYSPDELLGLLSLMTYIDEDKMVANIFGQKFYGYDGKCYTDYEAIRIALSDIVEFYPGRIVAIPYLMGCARGGGDWNIVSNIINEVFSNYNGEVLICECNKG